MTGNRARSWGAMSGKTRDRDLRLRDTQRDRKRNWQTHRGRQSKAEKLSETERHLTGPIGQAPQSHPLTPQPLRPSCDKGDRRPH